MSWTVLEIQRIQALEDRLAKVEAALLTRLGPQPDHELDRICREIKTAQQSLSVSNSTPPPPVDRTQQTLTDGSPVTSDYQEIQPDGMQKAYVVLSAEERAKGFVRPVRRRYRHLGGPGPKFSLCDLTEEQKERYAKYGYVKFEAYPQDYKSSTIGRYWTQAQLNNINAGCGMVTIMALVLAETYARDPSFYGATFCCGCGKHFPVEEFLWDGTQERVGT